jgi:pimeloyl-ACP methyl ester carboxylesterase
MATGRARNGEVELAYETFGPVDGEPLLLVMGMGAQMVLWPDELCQALAGAGFAVTRFDNRDFGLSSHLPGRAPGLWRMMFRPASAAPYQMLDLAEDAVAVIDAMGWAKAHVFGVSMGGYVAQLMAINHRERLMSLTSAMSWPDPRLSKPKLGAFLSMLRRFPNTPEGAGEQLVHIYRHVGGRRYGIDEQWLRSVARTAWERDHGRANGPRQAVAIRAGQDLRPALAGIDIPAVVLHGDDDRLVPIAAGRATATAIPNARFIAYPGMGHHAPAQLWPAIVDEVCAAATLAASQSR